MLWILTHSKEAWTQGFLSHSARGVLSWLPLVEAGSGGAALPGSTYLLFPLLFTVIFLFLFWCLLLSFVHPFPLFYSFSISLSSVIRKLKHRHQWHISVTTVFRNKVFLNQLCIHFSRHPVLNIWISNISKPVHYLLLAISLFPFIANVSIIWNIFTKIFFFG